MRRHLCFANVASALALFLALSTSGAYAATKLVTGKNVKNGSLTAADIKKGSLTRDRFKSGQLPAGHGATGPTGAAGPAGAAAPAGATGPAGAAGAAGPKGDPGAAASKGDKGDAGQRGPSAFDSLPSGTTVRGIGGGDFVDGGTGTRSNFVTLPAPAPVALTNGKLLLASSDATHCTGTAAAPAAAAGYVCVYSLNASNAKLSTPGLTVGQTGDAAKLGFGVVWSTSSAAYFIVYSWAYTAP